MRNLSMEALLAEEKTEVTPAVDDAHVTELVAAGVREDFARESVASQAKLGALEEAYWIAADDPETEEAFFYRCVAEGRVLDLVRLHIIDEDEAQILLYTAPGGFDGLEEWQQDLLEKWIRRTYEPSDTPYRGSSYGMKHAFDGEWCGFYVTNGAFKGAMLAGGHEPASIGEFPEYNWTFKVRRPAEAEQQAGECWLALADLYERRAGPVPLPYWRNAAKVHYGIAGEAFEAAMLRLFMEDHAVEVDAGWVPLYDG